VLVAPHCDTTTSRCIPLYQLVDHRHCWMDWGSSARTPTLFRSQRRSQQNYHFVVDSQQRSWPHIPTLYHPRFYGQTAQSHAGHAIARTNSAKLNKLLEDIVQAANDASDEHRLPDQLPSFFTPYIFSDSCDLLKQYAVDGCCGKTLRYHNDSQKSMQASGFNSTHCVQNPFQKVVSMHERCMATHLTYLVPWKFLAFRCTELTRSVQASRERYSSWATTASQENAQQQLGSETESSSSSNWIQWMAEQLTQLAQLVQDYQDHAARYRHMFAKFTTTSHSDLLSVGHESFGDTRADRDSIEHSPFRKSVWKSGFGGSFDRHVAINCHLQSLCVGGQRHHPVGETSVRGPNIPALIVVAACSLINVVNGCRLSRGEQLPTMLADLSMVASTQLTKRLPSTKRQLRT